MFIKLFLFILSCSTLAAAPFTIMIDPFGDATKTGSCIQDTLARALTLECAETLKQELQATHTGIRVILTRVPGETITPLQNASFANRLGVDLYVSLILHPTEKKQATVSLYYMLEQQADIHHQHNNSVIYPYQQAYLQHITTSAKYAQIFYKNFTNKNVQKFFKVIGSKAIGCPLAPLLGVQAPALIVDAGIIDKKDWQELIAPCIASIKECIA